MKDNPVFRHEVEIFYNEGYGLSAYLYILVILIPVEFLSLAIPALDVQMWTGSANLFKVCSITALLLLVYFAMRVANQEFAPWRFQSIKHWLRDEKIPAGAVGMAQLAFLSLHLMVSVFLCAPLLIWAGAIARTQLTTMLFTFFLLAFYSLSYGVWGRVTLVLWERKSENRQVLVRCFFFFVAVVSALVYLPLNPVAYLLSYLGQEELAPLAIGGWKWSATTIHFAFHLSLLATGIVTYRWALSRGGAV
jgi:hypothetical protein